MVDRTASQQEAFEDSYGRLEDSRWSFHYTDDPLTRYLRDRRLKVALRELAKLGLRDAARQTVLVVCGGVGGEGAFLRRAGFEHVTVSDFSAEALRLCERFNPDIETMLLDAEQMDLPASSFDVVLVQDGLHHLSRPVLGFTEMLRVAREAVVVIEPHDGLAGRLLGREWETEGDTVNYVFRWNRLLLEQCTRSLLLQRDATVIAHRMWDHNRVLGHATKWLPAPTRLAASKTIYAALRPTDRAGNMMVGVISKDG